MPDVQTTGIVAGIIGFFAVVFGLLTKRVALIDSTMQECLKEHGERLATLEAHYTDLKVGQTRIEVKLDRLLERE